jgi:hypothetical protein
MRSRSRISLWMTYTIAGLHLGIYSMGSDVYRLLGAGKWWEFYYGRGGALTFDFGTLH